MKGACVEEAPTLAGLAKIFYERPDLCGVLQLPDQLYDAVRSGV